MQNLEKRIAALETVSAPPEPLTIFRQLVVPGRLNAEMHHISDDHGKQWTRQPSETEQAFTERAESETTANQWGIKFLIGKTLELSHAND